MRVHKRIWRSSLRQAELHRYLPRMVSILCGKTPERDTIKQVFRKIIFVPDRRLLSTNEVRQNMQDQMLAADLLVLLHQEQAAIGLQAAIEGTLVLRHRSEFFKLTR